MVEVCDLGGQGLKALSNLPRFLKRNVNFFPHLKGRKMKGEVLRCGCPTDLRDEIVTVE